MSNKFATFTIALLLPGCSSAPVCDGRLVDSGQVVQTDQELDDKVVITFKQLFLCDNGALETTPKKDKKRPGVEL